jgi:hypothetical protein
VNNSDERDYAEEQANQAEMQEQDHCMQGYDDETERTTSCTDVDGGGDCVSCECCCTSLAMEYGPQNGMALTEAQRAPIRAFLDVGAQC